MKGYEIPEYSRQSKGLPIINLLQLDKDENISSILKISKDDEDTKYLVFTTKNGNIKRTAIEEFESIRKTGKIAIVLKENDELISVKKTCGKNEIVIGASNGRMVRFLEDEVRVMGRNTSGVKGIDLDGSYVVGSESITSSDTILIVTENGYGKISSIDEYRLTHRGSKGVKAYNVTDKNGMMVSLKSVVTGDYDMVIVTDSGIVIRMPLEQVPTLRRATQGVKLINLKDSQKVASVTIVDKDSDEGNLEENEA